MASATHSRDLGDKKQVLFTYAKLKSFEKAQKGVTSSLQQFAEDNDVSLVEYEDGKTYKNALAATGIVVIDVNQTRTLITPSRRDRNVDHWDELYKLSSGVTNPAGSVLIFLKDKKENETDKNTHSMDDELIGERWMSTWRFNDENAYKLAQKGRVFSFIDSLNTKQEATLRDYLQMVPLMPRGNQNTNILFLGNEESQEELSNCLDGHPYIKNMQPVDASAKIPYQYFNFFYKESGVQRDSAINVYYRDFALIKLCDSEENMQDALRQQITAGHFRGREISNIAMDVCLCSPCCYKFGNKANVIPSIDNVLFSCHCDKCFDLAGRPHVSEFMRRELAEVGIKVNGAVLPLPTNQFAGNQDVVSKCRSVIMDLKKQANEGHLAEKERRLQNLSPDNITKMYIYHVSQYPFKSHTHIVIPRDDENPPYTDRPPNPRWLCGLRVFTWAGVVVIFIVAIVLILVKCDLFLK